MRIIFDECMPRPLRRHLIGHEVSTVQKEKFDGLRNGRLLAAAQDKWDVLLTTDDHIPDEQSLRSFRIGVLIVRAIDNRLETLLPWVPEVLRTLPFVKPGTAMRIGDPKLLAQDR